MVEQPPSSLHASSCVSGFKSRSELILADEFSVYVYQFFLRKAKTVQQVHSIKDQLHPEYAILYILACRGDDWFFDDAKGCFCLEELHHVIVFKNDVIFSEAAHFAEEFCCDIQACIAVMKGAHIEACEPAIQLQKPVRVIKFEHEAARG
jgi:hypothetical protein